MSAVLSYVEKDSFIHRLTGTAKLLFFCYLEHCGDDHL